MALGPTHWTWDVDVRRQVELIERRFPNVRCNSYVGHPLNWPPHNGRKWEYRSIDVWGRGGRGHPIPVDLGWAVLRFVRAQPGAPYIRHDIYESRLWTSWAGFEAYRLADHRGALRHYHVTFW